MRLFKPLDCVEEVDITGAWVEVLQNVVAVEETQTESLDET